MSEDGAKATITVQRSGPPVRYGDGAVRDQQWHVATATPPTLAPTTSPTSGTFTFGPTVTQQTFTVTILNDFVIEPDETVTLTLSNPVAVGTGCARPFSGRAIRRR